MANPNSAALQAALPKIVQTYGAQPHYLLQMLWRIQENYNYIPIEAINFLAQALNLTPAHIEGVIEFFSLLRTESCEYDILFSDNIIEQMQGKQALMDALMKRLSVQEGAIRADGRVRVANTACIGMSDQGPAALVNGYTLTRLDAARLEQMAALIEAREPLKNWPQNWFQVTDNIQRKDFLLEENFQAGTALKSLAERGAESGLADLSTAAIRGCGGAGFRLDAKWTMCRNTPAEERFVICNADEGEPGTYKDRVLLQSYADLVFEGMTVCGRIIGAKRGFLYLRGEYRYMLEKLNGILEQRRRGKLLGKNILGVNGFDFDIEIFLGGGAYICGAENALIESMHGNRGMPRKRPPPFPVTEGYLNKPTVVNNVESFAHAAKVVGGGAERFKSLGTEQSRGTKLLSISGDCERPGVYEFPFGVTVNEVLAACGAKDVQAVQNSGPAGVCVSPAEFNRRLGFEDLNTTGSVMIFNQQRDLLEVARNFIGFFVHESCGFCTPCRVGTSLMKKLVEKVYLGRGSALDLEEMRSISQTVKSSANCGLGLTATNHIVDTLNKFPHIYQSRLKETTLNPWFDLDAAVEISRRITHRDDAGAHL